MSFFRDINKGMKEFKEVQKTFKNFGIDKKTVTDKYNQFNSKNQPAGEASTAPPAAAPAAPSELEARPGPVSSEKELVSPTTTAAPSVATSTSYAGTPATTNATPSVVHSTAPGAPAKLPLAARKSIRDDFESKREEMEATISKVMGTPWKIFYDAPGIYSYAGGLEFPLQNPGIMLYSYFRSAQENIRDFATQYGADGVAQLNAIAPSHTITLEPTKNKDISYCSCDIVHDALVILFKEDSLGTNADNAARDLGKKVNAAAATASTSSSGSRAALNLVARNSIAKDWEPRAGELLAEARDMLKAPTLTFVPNFEANYAAIRAWEAKGNKPSNDNWDQCIGQATYEYFNSFVSYLRDFGFAKDDMLQDGFKEAVDRNEVVLRCVDQLNETARKSYNERYNDCVVEGSTFYLETLTARWWSNTSNVADKIVDRL